jgi:transposase
MSKNQHTFTREFKLEAVQYGQHGAQAFPGSGHQRPQEEELRRFQRENELLRQERDILKRAMPLRGITANEHWYTGRERSQRQDGVYA